MLAGARLGDHPPLAHRPREKRLPERVVDLVGAGMEEVLALEEHLGPGLRRQPAGGVDGRRAPHVLSEVVVQLGLELRSAARLLVLPGELIEGGNQRLGDVTPAEGAEAAPCIRK